MARKSNRHRQRPSRDRSSPRHAQRDSIDASLTQAIGLERAGRLPEAEERFRRALALDPENPAALQHLGLLVKRQGRTEEAVVLLRRSLAHTPRDPVCHNNLGNMLREAGRAEEAIGSYRKAVEQNPQYLNAYHNLALALRDLERHAEAVECLQHALELAPERAELWDLLGRSLRKIHKLKEAAAAFETSLRLDPSDPEIHARLGSTWIELGDMRAGRSCLYRAIELRPDFAQPYEYLARSHKYGPEDMAEIARVEAQLAPAQGNEAALVNLHFALGKMYDDCAMPERAFPHIDEANRLRRRSAKFDMARLIEETSRSIELFTPEFFASRKDIAYRSDLPVFIVGLPRSGTTLIEQIIASHPQAHGAGELHDIEDAMKKLSSAAGVAYPGCVPGLSAELAQSLGRGYVERLQSLGGRAKRVTDKALTHVFNLGLIALLFPDARIIACRRDLMDVGASLYFQKFIVGTLEFCYELRGIAAYCRQFERLMRHWREVLPLRIHEVDYAALVRDQEGVTRALIDHCGLAWDERCLEFHETERSVSTASFWQVRQPLYQDSLHRAERYAPYLEELREELGRADDY